MFISANSLGLVAPPTPIPLITAAPFEFSTTKDKIEFRPQRGRLEIGSFLGEFRLNFSFHEPASYNCSKGARFSSAVYSWFDKLHLPRIKKIYAPASFRLRTLPMCRSWIELILWICGGFCGEELSLSSPAKHPSSQE